LRGRRLVGSSSSWLRGHAAAAAAAAPSQSHFPIHSSELSPPSAEPTASTPTTPADLIFGSALQG